MLILFVILILAACIPPTTPPAVDVLHTATPSAPSAIDLGTLGYGSAKTAAWSADGKILAVGSTQGIYLYDTTTWQTLKFIELQDDDDYRNGVAQLWFHPDGKSLYYTRIATPYLLIYQYDLASGETIRLYQEIIFSEFTTIIFSSNSEIFANIGATILDENSEPDLLPQIEIRETGTGNLLQTLKSDMTWWGSFKSGLVSFSPDGTLFATGGIDNTARVWDVVNGTLLFEQKHDADIQSLAFSPNGKMLVSTGNDATVRFWNAYSGESIYVLRQFEHRLVYLAYGMNGSELLLGTADGFFQQWTVDKYFLPVTRKDLDFKPDRYAYAQNPTLQYISPDGSKLAVINDLNLQIFDLTTAHQPVTLSEFNSYLISLEFSPDGSLLALVDYNVHLWDMDSRKALGTLQTNVYEVSDIAFAPSGKQIAVGAGGLEIWDISTLQKIREIDTSASRVAYSPDGSLLAAGGWYDATILDAASGRQIRSFKFDLGTPFALSFSADGKRLMFAAQNGMKMWDVSSGKLLQSMDEKKWRIDNALIYSSDNVATENFVNCMEGGELVFWNTRTTQESYALHIPFCGQGYFTIHPSNRLFAHLSGYNESFQISLSDLASGQNLLSIPLPNTRIESMRFSPNGKILAAEESDDAVIHLWDISSVAHTAESALAMTATPLPTETPTPSPTRAIADEIPMPLITPQAASPNAITIDNVDRLTQIGSLGGSLYNSSPYAVAWSDDSSQFAVGNLGSVHVYKIGADSPWRSFVGGNLVEDLVFSPNGRYLAEQNNRSEVIVWDLITGERARTFQWDCWNGQISFGTDDKTVTIECRGETRQTFDLQSGKMITQKEGGRYGEPNLDGSLLVSSDSYCIYLTDAQSGTILRVFESDASPWLTSFSPDGQTMLIWYYDAPIRRTVNGEEQVSYESIAELWHVLSGQEPTLQRRILTGATSSDVAPPTGQYYAFTSDGKYLITTVWDGFVRIWDTGTGDLLSELQGGSQVFLSADDRRLITLGPFGRMQIWDLTSMRKPKLLQTLTDFEIQNFSCPISFMNEGKEIAASAGTSVEKWSITGQPLNSESASYKLENRTRIFAASLDGSYWATDNLDGGLALRNPKSGKVIQTLDRDPQSLSEDSFSNKIERLLFSNSGDILAAASYRHIWLWDIKTGKMNQHIELDFSIGDLAFNLDGRLLAVSADNDGGEADIWDTQTGRRLRHFDFAGHQIAFSPDGLTLATGWRDGTIWLLDIRSGQMVRTMQAGTILWDIAFTPDGRLLAAKTGNDIEFWDVVQGKQLTAIDMFASCMTFSPDGTMLATYGNEDRIRLWGVTGK